jgi:hypothetical protein
MLDILVVLCLVAAVVWIVLKARATKRKLDQAAHDAAWREPLNEPNLELIKAPPPEPSTEADWEAYDARYEDLKRTRLERARTRKEGSE